MGSSGKSNKGIQISGVVEEVLPGLKYRVKLDNTDHIVQAYLSGKMRIHYIKILPGDRVTVELSPYDMTRGRIVYRQK
ncbi:MAG: translation initiation factor IF-1 [Desulfuromonas sp. SDB]|jgi:translation initiation factor IF-1|nr:MAG: translation initiation factor IF-1 [Desulfuromonas sp. SDB]